MKRKLRVLIGTPYYWALSSFNHNVSMLTQLHVLEQAGMEVFLQPMIGDAVQRQRNVIVAAMRELDYDVLVFVDVDTGFRGEDLLRMIEAELPVVGVNYPKRSYFFDAGANGEWADANELRNALLHGTIATKKNADVVRGMTEVWYIGTGLSVVRREVFEAMVDQLLVEKICSPCHNRKWVPYLHRWYYFQVTGSAHLLGEGHDLGEDWNFCDLARKAGFKVYCYKDAMASHAGWHNFEGTPRWPEPLDSSSVMARLGKQFGSVAAAEPRKQNNTPVTPLAGTTKGNLT